MLDVESCISGFLDRRSPFSTFNNLKSGFEKFLEFSNMFGFGLLFSVCGWATQKTTTHVLRWCREWNSFTHFKIQENNLNLYLIHIEGSVTKF